MNNLDNHPTRHTRQRSGYGLVAASIVLLALTILLSVVLLIFFLPRGNSCCCQRPTTTASTTTFGQLPVLIQPSDARWNHFAYPRKPFVAALPPITETVPVLIQTPVVPVVDSPATFVAAPELVGYATPPDLLAYTMVATRDPIHVDEAGGSLVWMALGVGILAVARKAT